MRKITTAATLTAMHKDDQQSVIWFLMLENVPGGEIIRRMCMVYHKINSEPMGTVIQGETLKW